MNNKKAVKLLHREIFLMKDVQSEINGKQDITKVGFKKGCPKTCLVIFLLKFSLTDRFSYVLPYYSAAGIVKMYGQMIIT